MKTAMYRIKETADSLILAPSKDMTRLSRITLGAATTGNLAGKAYLLLPAMLPQSTMIDKWLIAKDDLGRLCLIPRGKKAVS